MELDFQSIAELRMNEVSLDMQSYFFNTTVNLHISKPKYGISDFNELE